MGVKRPTLLDRTGRISILQFGQIKISIKCLNLVGNTRKQYRAHRFRMLAELHRNAGQAQSHKITRDVHPELIEEMRIIAAIVKDKTMATCIVAHNLGKLKPTTTMTRINLSPLETTSKLVKHHILESTAITTVTTIVTIAQSTTIHIAIIIVRLRLIRGIFMIDHRHSSPVL